MVAGFPGETLEEHEETKAFMRKLRLAKVHIFPYSRRSGTKADKMPGQLTNAEKSRRAQELIAVGAELERKYLSDYIGKEADVLIEKNEEGCSIGHTDTYVQVKIQGNIAPNSMARVQISKMEEDNDGELSLLSNCRG